jgi:hypothetical protein
MTTSVLETTIWPQTQISRWKANTANVKVKCPICHLWNKLLFTRTGDNIIGISLLFPVLSIESTFLLKSECSVYKRSSRLIASASVLLQLRSKFLWKMLLEGGGVFSCNAFPNVYPCFKQWLLRIHSEHTRRESKRTHLQELFSYGMYRSPVNTYTGVTVDVFMSIDIQFIL